MYCQDDGHEHEFTGIALGIAYRHPGTDFRIRSLFHSHHSRTNGAIHISDRFQDLTGMVSKTEKDGSVKFVLNSRRMLAMWRVA